MTCAAVSETMAVPADPAAVREARRLVARLCAQAGVGGDACDTAVLLTSEVVTNAVTHGRSEARVTVRVSPLGVRVEVGDDNSRPPALQPLDDAALDGRGVALLQAAASHWGILPAPVGKVVWFTLAAT